MPVTIMRGPGDKTVILIEKESVYFETPLDDEKLRLANIKVIIRGCEIYPPDFAEDGDSNSTN